MNRRLKFVLLIAFMAVNMYAQQITGNQALKIATEFCGANKKLSLAYVGGLKSSPDYYVYNIGTDDGFVIIAGDEKMPDIIPAYSLTGHFDSANINDKFKMILDGYSENVKETKNLKAVRATKRTMKITPRAEIITVGPLLGNIMWDQMDPYNRLCPNGAVTGCGATATAQVMKYHNWPLVGTGGTKGAINYNAQTYNWDLMLPKYSSAASDAEKNEVAKLMYHVGVAIDMKYGTNGSGTSIRSIPAPMAKYLSYSAKSKVAYRVAYSDADWISMIKREIDNKRPIVYSGINKAGEGHLFVCDGYDSQNKIHLNYGWSGVNNLYFSLSAITFISNNAALIGFYPNNAVVADADQAPPQIALLSSICCSKYSPKINESFDIGVKLSNYDINAFNGNIGVALYKGSVMQGTPIKQQAASFIASIPSMNTSEGIKEYDVLMKGVIIPTGTPDGSYKLKLVAQQSSIWFPMQYIAENVTKEINVVISGGVATFSYPINSIGSNLELTKPIDVSVSSNRAKIRFSVRNMDDFYNCTNTDIYVMANPNTGVLPTVWSKITIDNLETGMVKDFEINDIPVPPGADVTSCRFYIAYSRSCNQPKAGREVSADPMQPLNYNLVSYNIPKEVVTKEMIFSGTGSVAVPADYKHYNASGVEDASVWTYFNLFGYATAIRENALLVTSPIIIDDENYIIEWQMGSLHSDKYRYLLYVSTNGQDFSNFADPIAPVFDKTLSVDKNNLEVARYSLAKYAGKEICIAFKSTYEGVTGLNYFKLLNIKTPKDITLSSINVPGTAVKDKPITIKALVKNNSSANVTKIIGSYTIGGNKVEEVIDTDIPFSETKEIEFKQTAILTGKAGENVPISITLQIEGEDVNLLQDNTLVKNVLLANFDPRKGVLMYKTTKSNCYGCTTTYSALDNFDEYYPEYACGVEIWNDGSFKTTDFPAYMGGTTPSFYMNAKWTSLMDANNNLGNYAKTLAVPANISAIASYQNEDSRVLNIKLKANFAMPVKGNYKMGAIIIENNVKNVDGQIAGTAPTGDKLVKNHIPIGTIAVNDSPEGSIIADPEAKEYIYDCTFTVPNELAYKYRKDNIQVIAVLYGPKGEILNCTTDSHYLKLRETSGLSFAPLEGYTGFKQIYDIESPSDLQHNSITNFRATIQHGGTYKFRVFKDATWNGYRPKLVVNKMARYNRLEDKEEILEPDQYGVYTIENMQQNYTIEIEMVKKEEPETRSFELKYNGKLVNDGDIIEITDYKKVGTVYTMKFAPEVTNTSDISFAMRMKREEMEPLIMNRSNSLCWDQCMTVNDNYADCAKINSWETQYPYGELFLNLMVHPVLGTSVIKYTFMTNYKEDPTISAEVHFINNLITGVEGIESDNDIMISTKDGVIEIKAPSDMDAKIYDISGRLIRIVDLTQGINIITDLPKGVYIINTKKIIL